MFCEEEERKIVKKDREWGQMWEKAIKKGETRSPVVLLVQRREDVSWREDLVASRLVHGMVLLIFCLVFKPLSLSLLKRNSREKGKEKRKESTKDDNDMIKARNHERKRESNGKFFFLSVYVVYVFFLLLQLIKVSPLNFNRSTERERERLWASLLELF